VDLARRDPAPSNQHLDFIGASRALEAESDVYLELARIPEMIAGLSAALASSTSGDLKSHTNGPKEVPRCGALSLIYKLLFAGKTSCTN
jgi:hypothetical protein